MKEKLKQKVVESKREVILEEVSKLFEKDGFSTLKMQDIARSLGISIGALYNLFASKEELYLAYVEYQIRRFYQMLEDSTKGSGPLKALEIYVKLKFEVFKEKRKALKDPLMGDPLYFLKMGKAQYCLIEPIHKKLCGWFERLDETYTLKERNFMKLAYLFHSYTNGYIEYWIVHEQDLSDEPKEVVIRFLEGIKR